MHLSRSQDRWVERLAFIALPLQSIACNFNSYSHLNVQANFAVAEFQSMLADAGLIACQNVHMLITQMLQAYLHC